MQESNNSFLSQSNSSTSKRSARSASDSGLLSGKIPPQAVPLEEAVLGALLLEKDALLVVLDILRPPSFYVEAHQLIYAAIIKLFEKSLPVDLLTVTEALRSSGDLDKVGGPYKIVELTNRVSSSANIEYHARIIAQKHIQRELIRVSSGIIKEAYDDGVDVFDMLNNAEKGLFEITQDNLNRSYQPMGSVAAQLLKQLEGLKVKEDGLTGVPTGFIDLDKLTSGWQSSDLIIIAARPGMGKTSFVLSITKNAAKDFKKPVALFSLEMSNVQLVQRLVSMEAEVPGSKLRNGQLDAAEWKRLHKAIEDLSEVPIYLDDTPAINIFELRAKCRRLKMKHDIQLVIIDYLQLMSGAPEGGKSSGNREQEISSISRALKGMAKELNIPVIALSQLSRAVETRGGSKRPQLSDLRESGAIEQDADIVSFIYRPEYYQILEDEEGNSVKNMAEVIIAKHRNGALETVKLEFTSQFARFGNWNSAVLDSFGNDPFGNNNDYENSIITRSSKMNDDLSDVPF